MDLAHWSSEVERLTAVWASVCDQQAQIDVASWTADLEQMQLDMNDLQAAGLWSKGPHDLMSIIGLNRWELAHSAALAWLCTPDAGHGLGSRFLEALLGLTGAPIALNGPVTAVLEESRTVAPSGVAVVDLMETGGDSAPDGAEAVDGVNVAESSVQGQLTRADVVVRGAGWCLVIEVKVDATEQPKQAQRLYDGWKDEGDTRFIFLTRGGHPPQTIAEHERDQWRALRWRDLRSILSELIAGEEASSGTARPALLDYLRTLQTTF